MEEKLKAEISMLQFTQRVISLDISLTWLNLQRENLTLSVTKSTSIKNTFWEA